MSDHATDCDDCNESIPYGIQCWAVTKYYDENGQRVVKIICQDCYAKR